MLSFINILARLNKNMVLLLCAFHKLAERTIDRREQSNRLEELCKSTIWPSMCKTLKS